MVNDILAVDVGTTAFKMGVFDGETLACKTETSRPYEIHLYDQGKADIEPEKWWQAFRASCHELHRQLANVRVIAWSVTTPGLLAMDEQGRALNRAILFMDGRSRNQARAIRDQVGEEYFLQETCNLPASGGSSLASILWIRENEPQVWKQAFKFGHTNTYMVKRCTGNWAIDPSTVSITGLYNTRRHDLTWNQRVLQAAGIPETMLPPLMHSYDAAGQILPEIAAELGLSPECIVLAGGNDAVLAALSGGLTSPGDINDINGTCEITNVCVDEPVSSPNFNVRCHVIPHHWVTFFVLNTGGKAIEWFHDVFCAEMPEIEFYGNYVPGVLERFLTSEDRDAWNQRLPEYTPYLMGSRYSTEPLTAGFAGLRLETNRDDLLLGLLKGNALYLKQHLDEVADLIPLGDQIMTSGGASKIGHFLEAKRYWTGDFTMLFQDQSSLLGAAMLGQFYLSAKYATEPQRLSVAAC